MSDNSTCTYTAPYTCYRKPCGANINCSTHRRERGASSTSSAQIHMHRHTYVATGAKRGDSIFRRRRHARNDGGQRSKQNKSVTETDRPMVSSSPFRCLRINESRAVSSHVRIHNDTVLCLNSCDPFGGTCHV